MNGAEKPVYRRGGLPQSTLPMVASGGGTGGLAGYEENRRGILNFGWLGVGEGRKLQITNYELGESYRVLVIGEEKRLGRE